MDLQCRTKCNAQIINYIYFEADNFIVQVVLSHNHRHCMYRYITLIRLNSIASLLGTTHLPKNQPII